MPNADGSPSLSDLSQLALQGTGTQQLATQGFAPFVGGPLGFSPATQAAVGAFSRNALPVIQNQFALQGLANSPALGVAVGDALAGTLPQFIQGDLSNRLAAAQGLQEQGVSGLGQAGQFTGQSQALEQQLEQQRTSAALQAGTLAGVVPTGLFGGEAGGFTPTLQNVFGQQQLAQSAAGLSADIANTEAERQLQAVLGAGGLVTQLGNLGLGTAQGELNQLQAGLGGFGTAGGLQQGIAQAQADEGLTARLQQQGLAEQATTGLFGGAVLPPVLQQSGVARSSTSK